MSNATATAASKEEPKKGNLWGWLVIGLVVAFVLGLTAWIITNKDGKTEFQDHPDTLLKLEKAEAEVKALKEKKAATPAPAASAPVCDCDKKKVASAKPKRHHPAVAQAPAAPVVPQAVKPQEPPAPPVQVAQAPVASPASAPVPCTTCTPTPVAIDYGHSAPVNGMCTITVVKDGNRSNVQARLVVTKHRDTGKILVTQVAEYTKDAQIIGRPLWTPHVSPGTCDGDKALVTKDWAIIVKMMNLPNDCKPEQSPT